MKDKSNQFFFYVLKVSYYWDGVLSNRIFCLIAFHSSYSGIFADLYDLILMEKKRGRYLGKNWFERIAQFEWKYPILAQTKY